MKIQTFLYIGLLNLLFYICLASIIATYLECVYFPNQENLTFSDFLNVTTYLYAVYVVSTLLFFIFYDVNLKEKAWLFITNVIVLRITRLNEMVIDFILNTHNKSLLLSISGIILFFMIYHLIINIYDRKTNFK